MSKKDLLAHYDPITGEIAVTAKSKIIRLHEYRHSQQPRKPLIIMSYWMYAVITLMAVVAVASGIWWFYAIFLPPFIWVTVMEIDAWIYAIRNR